MAIIYNSVSLIFLAGVGLILPLFLFMILIYQYVFLKISFDKSLLFQESGESTQLNLQFWNQSVFPVGQITMTVKMKNLTTGEKRKQRIKKSLHTKMNEILFPVSELSYGVWHISCQRIRLYDPLHWFFLQKWKKVQTEIIQMPHRYEVNLIKTAMERDTLWEKEAYETGKTGTDASYIKEIREYQSGDRVRNIHWKLSAKKDQLMVKEYGQPSGQEVVFGLDMERLEEKDIVLIYSLLVACAEKGFGLLMMWKSQDNGLQTQFTVHKEEDVYLAMECLMRSNVSSWGEETEDRKEQLWLKNGCLYWEEIQIQDFSHGDFEEKLLEMELML